MAPDSPLRPASSPGAAGRVLALDAKFGTLPQTGAQYRFEQGARDFTTGQQVRAQFVEHRPDGQFRFLLGAQTVDAAVQAAPRLQAGQWVELRVVATTPRLLLEPAAGPASVRATVSEAGRLLRDLLSTRLPDTTPPSRPLAPHPVPEGKDIVRLLQHALTRSGLFYESHLARWTAGQYPIESLREEPQARIGRAHAAIPPAPPPAANASTQTDAYAGNSAARQEEVSPSVTVPREMAPIVRHQVEALEAGRVAWHGELFPGMRVDWEIQDEQPETQHQQRDREWTTRVGLETAAMGGIDAELRVSESGVSIVLLANSADTASALKRELSSLRSSLEAAGVNPNRLEVRDHVRLRG